MQETILLVKLMRQALRQETFQCDGEFNIVRLKELIRDQGLVSFVCPAMMQVGDEKIQLVARDLSQEYNEELHRALVQQIEMEDLLIRMEDMGMDCLPLKGYIMKNYYSEPTFRSMTDFDVLLKEFDEKKIQSWMESIGYVVEEQGDEHHDVYVKKPYMVAELHKNLSDEKVEREIPEIDEWLEHAWDRCILTKGKNHTYEMTEEDFYIYHLIHLYKHMRHGGISVRPLVDTYVFLDKVNDTLDWFYIQKVLEGLKLVNFEAAIKALSMKCFGEDIFDLNEDEEKLLRFFCENGMFGDSKSTKTISVVTEGEESYTKGKMRTFLRIIFQPAKVLKDKYPILEKHPFLVPFIWVVRIFRVLFKERYKIELLNEASTKEEYNKMREIFCIAGIVNK